MPTPPRLSPLALVAGMSGNLMEWYDFALYGVLASTLGELFFPADNRLTGLLSVFGVFAAGYVMRVIGGAAFGHIADHFGRRRALLVSAVAMAVATAAVGCLPTYASAGIVAPILFTLLRLVQGLSVGGEFTASVAYLIEHAPPHRRGLQGSLAPLTGGIGVLLGSALGNTLFELFGSDAVLAWAWRIPFLFSIPLGVSLAILRATLPEDAPQAAAAHGPQRSPVWTVLREHPGEIVRGALLGWGPNVGFYTIAVFIGSYVATEGLLPQRSALSLQTASIALMIALTPVAGFLGDRAGRRAMVLCGGAAAALVAWPLLAILRNGDPSDDLAAELLFAAVVVLQMTPYQVWLAERFPRALRGSGFGIAYNGAAGILGGTTPLVCTALVAATHNLVAPAAYVIVAVLVSMAVALRTPETAHAPLA